MGDQLLFKAMRTERVCPIRVHKAHIVWIRNVGVREDDVIWEHFDVIQEVVPFVFDKINEDHFILIRTSDMGLFCQILQIFSDIIRFDTLLQMTDQVSVESLSDHRPREAESTQNKTKVEPVAIPRTALQIGRITMSCGGGWMVWIDGVRFQLEPFNHR